MTLALVFVLVVLPLFTRWRAVPRRDVRVFIRVRDEATPVLRRVMRDLLVGGVDTSADYYSDGRRKVRQIGKASW